MSDSKSLRKVSEALAAEVENVGKENGAELQTGIE
jgi:hypothetical protein